MKQPETCRDMYKAIMFGHTVQKPCMYDLTQNSKAYKNYVKNYKAWRRLQEQEADNFWKNFKMEDAD